jgi:uncharacterized protein HemX
MALPQSVNKLKNEGSKEDKVAVAGGIAITVVVVLLAGWAIFFFRSIANNSQNLQIGSGAQDQFNFQNVRDAQQQIQQNLSSQQQSELQQSQYDSASSGGTVQMQIQGQGSDPFGSPTSGN